MRARRARLALLAVLVSLAPSGCAKAPASPAPSPPPAPSSSAEAPEPEPPAAPEPPAVRPPPELSYDERRTERIEQLAARALGLVVAFGNTSPRPVFRGYGQVLTVQFSSDWRSPGLPRWLEAPALSMHGAPLPAEKLEPCQAELLPGAPLATPAGRVEVKREGDHDELWVGEAKKRARVKLPRGALHGGCLDPERRRLWLGWSSPDQPAELFVIGIRDATVRPLRRTARPGLGALREARVEHGSLEGGAPFVLIEPATPPEAALVLLAPEADGPLARWDGLARAAADAGLAALRVSPDQAAAAVALARSRWAKPVSVLSRGTTPPPPVDGASPIWLVRPEPPDAPGPPEAPLPSPPPGTLVVGEGEAVRPELGELARTRPEGLRWTVADAGDPARSQALAWARIIDAALSPAAP